MEMSYYFAKTIQAETLEAALAMVKDALGAEGFGVLTEIDVRATMKKKLDVDFPDYHILGACNPALAHKALLAENKIGTMLPCNVIVQKSGDGFEVAAVDPAASMASVKNDQLAAIAGDVRDKLRQVVESL